MTTKAFQDYYPDNYSHCYGCGRLNDRGMHIKSYWTAMKDCAVLHPNFTRAEGSRATYTAD